MKNLLLSVLLIVLSLSLLSCSDSSTGPSTPGDDNGDVNASFTVSGEVEGNKTGFGEAYFQVLDEGLDFELYIEGENFELYIQTLGFLNANSVEARTYQIGSFESELNAGFDFTGDDDITFDTFIEGTGGTLTISSVAPGRMAGTFQFTASAYMAETDSFATVTIEEGVFNVQLIEF